MIIALKGANRDILQSPHCAVSLGAILCKSRAAHRVLITCNMLFIKFDRVEIAFIWALFLLAEPLTDEGEKETGIPGENP